MTLRRDAWGPTNGQVRWANAAHLARLLGALAVVEPPIDDNAGGVIGREDEKRNLFKRDGEGGVKEGQGNEEGNKEQLQVWRLSA